MKKIGFSAVLTGVVCVAADASFAAYPVYKNYQSTQNMPVYQQYNSAPTVVLPTAGNSVMTANSAVAAQPTRITGMLPHVGSNAKTAGRQYYQPTDYDRLADSGLYIGLSASYSASVMGAMSADYASERDAYVVPGAFRDADFETDTVIPLQVSVGAALNNDVRVDFSYLRYGGISYPKHVMTSDGAGGNVDCDVDGGAITANTTMLNIYYNLDSYTGYMAGGVLRPYIGIGAGISLNTVADYVIYDDTYYTIEDSLDGLLAGTLTGISDIYAYHNGGTTEQFAFMLEGGVTTDLDGGLKLDFFARYANLGKVKTSGSIVLSQTKWLSDGASGEYAADYDSVFHYTNWYESGRLSMVDVGVRLRLQF